MARSGSTNFSVTRDNLIQDALEDLGILPIGGTLTTAQKTKAALKLNLMVKRDMARGMHLWTFSEGTLFGVDNQESYSLGTGGDEAASTYVKTELAADVDSGETNITVDSITGISNGDAIGVELDDGSLQWTTVNGVPAGSTIVLTAALTDDVSENAHVYAYTTIIEKPLRLVKETIRLENESGTETPVRLVSRAEYLQLSNKAISGKTNQVYYDATWGTTGTLYVWPTWQDVRDVLHFTFERTLQDFDADVDNPDFPISAADYLVKGLRYELAVTYGLGTDIVNMMRFQAEESRDDWMFGDSEDSSIFLHPDMRG